LGRYRRLGILSGECSSQRREVIGSCGRNCCWSALRASQGRGSRIGSLAISNSRLKVQRPCRRGLVAATNSCTRVQVIGVRKKEIRDAILGCCANTRSSASHSLCLGISYQGYITAELTYWNVFVRHEVAGVKVLSEVHLQPQIDPESCTVAPVLQ